MAECFYLVDPKTNARDLYCPDCAETESSDPWVNERLEKSDADNGATCVLCDKVADAGEFVVPDCFNCGGTCRDSNGAILWVKFGQPQADPFYICPDCFAAEGRERGVL